MCRKILNFRMIVLDIKSCPPLLCLLIILLRNTRTQVGRERYLAFCLMQKYADLKSIGTKLHIVSAISVEHVKGFIFIEADKQPDINEVLSFLQFDSFIVVIMSKCFIVFIFLLKKILNSEDTFCGLGM